MTCDPFYTDPTGWGTPESVRCRHAVSDIADARHKVVDRVGEGAQITTCWLPSRNRLHVIIDHLQVSEDFL